jgi:hypothetical protein
VTSPEAKQLLRLYRPGGRDEAEPEIRAALDQVAQDPALAEWFEHHCAVQRALQEKFREITPPAHLRAALRPPGRIITGIPWRGRVWAAAAALAVLAALTVWWTRPRPPDRFADFRDRMVRTALREYHMDVTTNDFLQVRKYLKSRGVPSDFPLPVALPALGLAGGGALRWRNQPVAMTCFNRGDGQMLFLFVLARSAVPDPPPATPHAEKVSKLETAAWSAGEQIFLLAAPDDQPMPGPLP